MNECEKAVQVMVHDKLVNSLYAELNNINWQQSSDPYYLYFESSEKVFVIRDGMLDNYFFIKADNAEQALEMYRQRMEDATQAGSYVPEEPE